MCDSVDLHTHTHSRNASRGSLLRHMLKKAFGYVTERALSASQPQWDRRGEKHTEVRGGFGSLTAQGFFPQWGPSTPLSSGPEGSLAFSRPPHPEGMGTGISTHTWTRTLTLDTHSPSFISNMFTFLGRGCVNAADEGARSMRANSCVCVCYCLLVCLPFWSCVIENDEVVNWTMSEYA